MDGPMQAPNEDRGPAVIAIFWSECVVSIVVVALRFYSRIMIKAIGVDDWVMLVTVILFILLSALVTVVALNGGSRHFYYLTPEQIPIVLKYFWAFQPPGIMALATSKISIGFLLLRILPPGRAWQKWSLYTLMFWTFIFGALASIFGFAQCNPPRALWETVPDAKCWNPSSQANFSIFLSSWYILVDFYLAFLPLTILYTLQMSPSKKAKLASLLGLGSLAGVCGLVKVTKIPGLANRTDQTWATYPVEVWTVSEIFLLVVCGSIPTLRPLYEKIRGRSANPGKSSYATSYKLSRSHDYAARIPSLSNDDTKLYQQQQQPTGTSTKITASSNRMYADEESAPQPPMPPQGIKVDNAVIVDGWRSEAYNNPLNSRGFEGHADHAV